MKRLIIFLVIPLLAACVLFEDDDRRTYFKAEGVGYVYNWHTKEPEQNAIIYVAYGFESRNFGTIPPGYETFRSDENGYFRVRFLKRTNRCNVAGYTISVHDANNNLSLSPNLINFTVDKLKGLNILKLDTLWIR